MKFNKKIKNKTAIPTSSMSDVVFILLLFFMVTTVFRQFSGLPLELPTAKKILKLDAKKNVTNIWANAEGEISIDDKIVRKNDIAKIIYQKRVENPKIVISLKMDRGANMGDVTDIQEELREADALKINYCAKFGD